jgi:hypothetical protein
MCGRKGFHGREEIAWKGKKCMTRKILNGKEGNAWGVRSCRELQGDEGGKEGEGMKEELFNRIKNELLINTVVEFRKRKDRKCWRGDGKLKRKKDGSDARNRSY